MNGLRYAHHVGLTVRDVERSVDFYHGLLELELFCAPTDWMDDEHMAEALGVDAPAKLRLAAFRVGDGPTIIETLEYGSPPSERERALLQNHIGASHVGIEVADIDAWVEKLRAAGVHFNSSVNDVEDGPYGVFRWVYFRDPDGHTLELLQTERPNDDERARDIEAYLASRSG